MSEARSSCARRRAGACLRSLVASIALSVWISACSTANIPTVADFLIATEAEINKVSWSSRKRLIQDTIVVLVTTVLLTGFLLVIDLFWGWLLADVVKVLPKPTPKENKSDPTQSSKW